MRHPQLAVDSQGKAPAARRPPGPRGLPWIGNALSYLRDPLGFLSGCAARYGDVVRLRWATATWCRTRPTSSGS